MYMNECAMNAHLFRSRNARLGLAVLSSYAFHFSMLSVCSFVEDGRGQIRFWKQFDNKNVPKMATNTQHTTDIKVLLALRKQIE